MTIFSSSFFSNRGKEGTLSISPLIRSDRGKTRLGHICKTITSPDSMLEITSFRRFLDDFDYRFRTLNAFPTSMQFSSFSFPSSCGENSARRAYLRDDNVRFNARNDVVKISGWPSSSSQFQILDTFTSILRSIELSNFFFFSRKTMIIWVKICSFLTFPI